MLPLWMEILPLFLIRILAKKFCERVPYSYEGRVQRICATARPDILIKVDQFTNISKRDIIQK